MEFECQHRLSHSSEGEKWARERGTHGLAARYARTGQNTQMMGASINNQPFSLNEPVDYFKMSVTSGEFTEIY